MIGTLDPVNGRSAMQLSLGLLDVPDRMVPPQRGRRERVRVPASSALLLERFRRRLMATGASRKAQEAYFFQMERLLAAARRHGLRGEQDIVALFRNEVLLGRALVDDAATRGGRLSRWTLAQQRATVRSFTRLMAPELRPALRAEPEDVVIAALRGVAERVGGGYRLSGGTPRRRGGRAPDADEVRVIIVAAGAVGGFQGRRNRAFLTLLHETGSRVNALRGIDGRDIIELPDGRLRLLLHAKGRPDRREVEVSEHVGQLLRDYVGHSTARRHMRVVRSASGWASPGRSGAARSGTSGPTRTSPEASSVPA
jgi:integrase